MSRSVRPGPQSLLALREDNAIMDAAIAPVHSSAIIADKWRK